MSQKKFSVRFYVGNTMAAGRKVSDLLQDLYVAHQAGQPYPHLQNGSVAYELRDFTSFNSGAVFQGVLAVLRDDAPNIRDHLGAERPIALQQGERVIEKNHFLFYADRQLLVWQVNTRASHVSRFEQYLGVSANAMVNFDDIILPASLRRVTEGTVKKLSFRIASPKNPDLVPSNMWSAEAMQMMNGAGATSIKIDLSTRLHKGLAAGVKNMIRQLKDGSEAESIRVTLAGDSDPIDLVADSIKGVISVKMLGMYPDLPDMFVQLEQMKEAKKGILDEFFGQGSRVLV